MVEEETVSGEAALANFYLVTDSDEGLTYRGPYTMVEAEALVWGNERMVTASKLAEMQGERPQPGGSGENAAAQLLLLREVRSWGFWSLGLGFLHIVSAGFLNAPWGILLIVVGLLSFYFRAASMFVVYGITLTWAAISNLLSAQGGWAIFALFQLYLAYRLFRQFFHFRGLQHKLLSSERGVQTEDPFHPQRAARIFPWAAGALGVLALFSFVTFFVAVVGVAVVSGQTELPAAIGFVEGLLFNLAILAVAMGLASLLSRYRFKGIAVLGMVTGILVIVVELGLALLG
jgi:hypothetical protein